MGSGQSNAALPWLNETGIVAINGTIMASSGIAKSVMGIKLRFFRADGMTTLDVRRLQAAPRAISSGQGSQRSLSTTTATTALVILIRHRQLLLR